MELLYLLKMLIEKGRRRISSIIPFEGSFDERGAPGIRSSISSMSQVGNNLARLIPCASRSVGLTG